MSLAVLSSIAPLLPQCSAWHLQLDKFSLRRGGEAEAKADALKAAIKTYTRSKAPMEKTVKARQDWLKSLATQHGPRFLSVRLYNQSPLMLHLGRASVLENVGLYCERTTGLPVIPGTAVKGVLSTWACWEANQNADGSFPEPENWTTQRAAFPADFAHRILGSDAENGSEVAGEISFLGAWPASPPVLSLDLVNPHHDATGRDLTRLTPSVFLSLESGTAWDFVFIARHGAKDAADLLVVTGTWLREALSQMGLGAKTAAGYGRFGDTLPTSAPAGPVKQLSAEDAALKKQAIASLKADYPNDATFKNRVVDKLDNPVLLNQLESEVPLLRKPENADRLEQLKKLLVGRDAKELRKRLKDKAWFPPEWMPQS